MIDPSTAKGFLSERSQEQIADWVRIGLEHYVREAGGFGGFAPLEQYFDLDLPVAEGFAALDAVVDSAGKSKLRNAIAHTLDALPVNPETASIIKQVLYCARRISAPEIFRYLPKKMKGMSHSEGEFFQASSEEIGGRTLFDVAFQVTADMPVAGSEWVLKELIATVHFHFSQSAIALDALCRIDPANFPTHFETLRDGLRQMFATYKMPTNVKRLLAKRLITSIGLNLFSDKHDRIRFEASSNRANDNWFYYYLFEDSNPLLLLDGARIAWADQQTKKWYMLAANPDPIWLPHFTRVLEPKPEQEEYADSTRTMTLWARLSGKAVAA